MSASLQEPLATSQSGITFRSVGAALLGLVLQACLIQVAGGILGYDRLFGAEAIAMPALMIGIGLIGLSALGYFFGRAGFFSRAELICVFYVLLLAAPLMVHGFWRPMISVVSAVPRAQSWAEYDALNPRAWPKGDNLMEGVFEAEGLEASSTKGQVSAATITVRSQDDPRPAVRLRNEGATDESSVRFFLPLGEKGVSAGMPYLLTVLARAEALEPAAWYYSRVYYDDRELPDLEPFVSRQVALKTVIQPEGFVRLGNYGLELPVDLKSGITVELGLRGQGEVIFAEPLLADVASIEFAFSGKRLIDRADYEAIPEHLRGGLIVRPDRMLSLDGLRFIAIGFISLDDWLMPVLVWSSIIALLLLGTFALVVIMRRQWVQNERFPMPMAEIPIGLLSVNRESSIWRDRMFLTGLIVTLIWSGFRGWNAFNPAIPSLEIYISLKTYLPDASWGATWDQVVFRVLPLVLGIGLLMELNILISLVIGYLLFRMQYWFGESTGLSVDRNFPHAPMQIFGSFGGYALAILFFTRKYLKEVFRLALVGGNPGNEVVSYRTATLLLILSITGASIWGMWMNVRPVGMVFFFLYLLAFSLVMARVRAEGGTPFGMYFVAGFTFSIPLISTYPMMGIEGVVIGALLSAMLGGAAFMNLPGLQLEMVELGHRLRIKRGHVVAAILLGITGGFVVGGWSYLSTAYSVSLDEYFHTGEYLPMRDLMVKEFDRVALEPNRALQTGQTSAGQGFFTPQMNAFLFGATGAGVTATLRQMFAGFWFHPFGFLLGATEMMRMAWGSLLLAWIIRFTCLKLGGAAVIREKLRPLAIGIITGAVATTALFWMINTLSHFFTPGGNLFFGHF